MVRKEQVLSLVIGFGILLSLCGCIRPLDSVTAKPQEIVRDMIGKRGKSGLENIVEITTTEIKSSLRRIHDLENSVAMKIFWMEINSNVYKSHSNGEENST